MDMATSAWAGLTGQAACHPACLMTRNAAECTTSSTSLSSAFDFGAARSIRCSGDGGLGKGRVGQGLGHARNVNQQAKCRSPRRWRGGDDAAGENEMSSSLSVSYLLMGRSGPSASSGLSSSFCLRAKRKSSEDATRQLQDGDEQLDEDMRLGLNEISTEALRAMLLEDDKVVEELREKVEDIENYLARLEQFDAANFMLVVKGLLDHEVLPATAQLKGAYKSALARITSVIEDSGWVLKREDAEPGGVEMVDDELMPPVLNSQYQ